MLLDFGLSVMSDEQRRTSLRNAGAIEFMAPEQHEGEMLVQSDVYSFGIILHELVAGEVPFPLMGRGESSRNAVMVGHLEKPLPDILELRNKNIPPSWEESRKDFEMLVPAWLLNVISKCLEKRPENRFADGVELHNAIVESSELYMGKYAYDSNDSAVLKRENERLKTLLMQYHKDANVPLTTAAAGVGAIMPEVKPLTQQADSPFNRPTKPKSGDILRKFKLREMKPVLIGLGILMACLVLFAGYSAFNSPISGAVDSVALNAEKQKILDSLKSEQQLQAQRTQDSIDEAKRLRSSTVANRLRNAGGSGRQSEKQRERNKKEAEKQWETEKKEAEKIQEELKKQFEKLREGKDN